MRFFKLVVFDIRILVLAKQTLFKEKFNGYPMIELVDTWK